MARRTATARRTWVRGLDRRRGAIVAATTCALACSSGAQTVPLSVTVVVESDPGVPLPDARILYGDRTVGTTALDGRARLTLGGVEGQSFDLSVRCPQGYRSPTAPVSVTLRRLTDPGKAPLYEASCKPALRNVVVVVTADKGPNLPVLYLGGEVARTDASGAAHVLLRIPAGEQFSLTLATTGKGAEALRPRDPVATFAVGERDDVFVFDPHFTLEQRRGRALPRGPTELGR